MIAHLGKAARNNIQAPRPLAHARGQRVDLIERLTTLEHAEEAVRARAAAHDIAKPLVDGDGGSRSCSSFRNCGGRVVSGRRGRDGRDGRSRLN
jgi:hypothetical protein